MDFKMFKIDTKIVCSATTDYKEVSKHVHDKCYEFISHFSGNAPGNKPLKVLT